MSLADYMVRRDKFQLTESGTGMSFPCCVCDYRHGADTSEPCRTCDHNTNAEPEDACPNCEAAMPEGCGGIFHADGASCRLNKVVQGGVCENGQA